MILDILTVLFFISGFLLLCGLLAALVDDRETAARCASRSLRY
jgi:hypothetical protein